MRLHSDVLCGAHSNPKHSIDILCYNGASIMLSLPLFNAIPYIKCGAVAADVHLHNALIYETGNHFVKHGEKPSRAKHILVLIIMMFSISLIASA